MVSLQKILNKHSGLAAFTTATALTLTNASPSFAIDFFKFGFCATFLDGGSVDGFLSVDGTGEFNNFNNFGSDTTQQPGDIIITATEIGETNKRTYTVADFVSLDKGSTITDGVGGPSFAAYKYTFKYDGLPLATDRFEAYLPASYFSTPITTASFGLLEQVPTAQLEYRNNFQRIDPDKITPVPWETDALPVIGSTILFGCGVWFKRKSANAHKKDLG